jgi:hypothetical protein
MFVFVSHLAVERREEELLHFFFQQTSNIFINACVKLRQFYALMCQNMILIEH